MASSSGSPCAACKFLRRKCTAECVFAPYFPPDQPHKFANVHKIFGASNISKLLSELPPHQREDAVNSLAFEAEARVKDPVYGCVGTISVLKSRILQLQQELVQARSDLARISSTGAVGAGLIGGPSSSLHAGRASSLGSGVTLAGTFPQSMQQLASDQIREQYMRERETKLAMNVQLLEIERESQLTREQLVEQLTRAGRGSFEAGLAAFQEMAAGFGMHPPGGTATSGPGTNYARKAASHEGGNIGSSGSGGA